MPPIPLPVSSMTHPPPTPSNIGNASPMFCQLMNIPQHSSCTPTPKRTQSSQGHKSAELMFPPMNQDKTTVPSNLGTDLRHGIYKLQRLKSQNRGEPK